MASCSTRMRRPGARQGGFTYVALLLAVALVGSTLAWAGESWQMAKQRELERQLLFAGEQIRQALVSYARSGAKMGQYPSQLEALLDDPRQPALKRHLRRIPPDPMTGKADWVLITNELGAIVGVHSRSQRRPVKRANFPPGLDAFEEAASYADWRFTARRAAALRQNGDQPVSDSRAGTIPVVPSHASRSAAGNANRVAAAGVAEGAAAVEIPLPFRRFARCCDAVRKGPQESAAPGGAGGTG